MHAERNVGLGNRRLAQCHQNYRLSGATTEVNSECYAALQTVAQMARVLQKHEDERAL